MKILGYYFEDNLLHSLSRHTTLNALLKFKSHPNISIIKSFSQRFLIFYFSQVDRNTVIKKILNKVVQDIDIPVKILKETADYFAEHICL